MRKIKYFFFSLFILLIFFLLAIFSNPYSRLRNYNEDWGIGAITYMQIYQTVMPKRNFNKLMIKLIDENMDIPSINIVALYCKKKKLNNYRPLLQKKCDLFNSYPADTTWSVEIDNKVFRTSNKAMLSNSNSFCNLIKEYW